MVDQWFVNQLTETQETPTPGMAIGRFPAWSTAELATMVGKTIAYEQAPASAWATRSIALVDSTDYIVFEPDAASFQRSAAPRWPDTITVHVRSNSPAHRSAGEFRDLWNQGSAFVNFIGHMGGPKFSAGSYFTSQDTDSLSPGSPLAMCLMGGSQRFERSDTIPIAVALLRASGRGAVCAIAPSGLMYQSTNSAFQDSLLSHLARWPHHPIGTAWLSVEQHPPSQIEYRRTLLGDPALVIKSSAITSTGGAGNKAPPEYTLFQNYPNPFNPSTTIRYALPQKSHVLLTVFNTLGQLVGLLVQGDQEAGYHEVHFDASGLSSGVYFYRLTAGGFVQTRKLHLLR